MDMCRGFSSLTMLPATRSMQTVHYLLVRWSKVCFFFKSFESLISFPRALQHQRRDGPTITVVCTCVMALSSTGNRNPFITQKTTSPCPAGSRAWKLLFVNAGCGQTQAACSLSAPTSSALLATRIAAAGTSCSFSRISLLRNPSLKS
jgi:hypothetical protein